MRTTLTSLVLTSLVLYTDATAGSQAVRLDVKPIKQPYNLCMVASVAMVLQYWGFEVSPEEIAGRVPLYKDGTTGRDLLRFVEAAGYHGFLIQPELPELLQHVKRGRPVIVSLPGRGTVRHSLVVVGYDETSITITDPAMGKDRVVSMQEFSSQWQETHRWTFLILPP